MEKIITQNSNSIFIRCVHESEVLEIVAKFTNKMSTDCTDIDMTLIKDIIDTIVMPFAYLCNQSLLTGIFQFQTNENSHLQKWRQTPIQQL